VDEAKIDDSLFPSESTSVRLIASAILAPAVDVMLLENGPPNPVEKPLGKNQAA
jgi:hypothetical protein